MKLKQPARLKVSGKKKRNDDLMILKLAKFRWTHTIKPLTGCNGEFEVDGHFSFLQGDAPQPALAIRCCSWNRGFELEKKADMKLINATAEMNVSATVNGKEPDLVVPESCR